LLDQAFSGYSESPDATHKNSQLHLTCPPRILVQNRIGFRTKEEGGSLEMSYHPVDKKRGQVKLSEKTYEIVPMGALDSQCSVSIRRWMVSCAKRTRRGSLCSGAFECRCSAHP
jgi:hypothetical protein